MLMQHHIDVKSIVYHRNGVSGAGFHVVAFAGERQHMIGVVFDEPGCVAILDRDNLSPATPKRPLDLFQSDRSTCYRGDHFESALRQLIADETTRYDEEARVAQP